MERIKSFSVNHDALKPGLYISRVDRDIVTYDLRFCEPNCGEYLDNPAIHTMEHLMATYMRNSEWSDHVIYVGPMGCRTGFYLIFRDFPAEKVIELTQESLTYILEFSGEIPGTSCSAECGNYLEHDLDGAKRWSKEMLDTIKEWTVEMLEYEDQGQGV